MTFAETEVQTNRMARVLATHGVRHGDRVAVMMPNSLDFPVCWLAILKVGAVMVPVNIRYKENDLRHTLTDSGAKTAVAGAEEAKKIAAVKDNCPALEETITLEEPSPSIDGVACVASEIRDAEESWGIDHLSLRYLANIQYTSGTTGFSKGCMLTHDYWLRLGMLAGSQGDLGEDDVALTAQPFYYMDPQWNSVMCMIAGIPLVILPRFSASTFWQSVKENDVTFFYLLGTMPVYLLKQPPDPEVEKNHRMRLVVCSGIVPQLHATFEERWNVPWREAFGMTETGVDLMVPFEDDASVGSGAMGKPVATKEARVIDVEGNELPAGKVGQLTVKGKPMMDGYWNRPEATAETIRDGWLHTGDLVTRDEKGYFHMVGRLKDMIRRSGENISAAEVESVLCEHPKVGAAACVPVPDELRGEEVKAFIQLQNGETGETAPPSELIAFAGEKLADFKLPRYIEYVDSFPLTPSERIAKPVLMEQKSNQLSGCYDAESGTWRD